VRDGADLSARTDLALAATFAGMGFGNAGVHIPHADAYPIAGGVKEFRPPGYPDAPLVPHGMAVALTAPEAFRFTFPADPARHLRAASLLGGADATGELADLEPAVLEPADLEPAALEPAERLPAALVALMRDIGMPNGIGAVGYTESDVDTLVAGALKQQRLLATAPRPAGEADLAAIFRHSLTLW